MNIIKTSEYSIECDICGASADTNTLEDDFIKSGSPKKYFIKNGWREKDGVTTCPECLFRQSVCERFGEGGKSAVEVIWMNYQTTQQVEMKIV